MAIGLQQSLPSSLYTIHVEANKSGVTRTHTHVLRVPESRGGRELVSFRRHEIRSITRPRINYELNGTEAACDRKLFRPAGTDPQAN